MRVLFLGTGASQGYPALFCACDNCESARARGGRSLRRRSAVLIEDDLLIDFGPDLFAATLDHRLALHNVCYLLLTHGHGDHLLLKNFDYRRERWAQQELPTMEVYASEATLQMVRALEWSPAELRVELRPVEPGQTWPMGPYRVTALPAHHAPGQQALTYVVERDGAALLYATDTGAFPPHAWKALERLSAAGVRLDGAVIEATMGLRELPPEAGHMNFARCVEHHRQLRERGITGERCVRLATHFAPGCQQWNDRAHPDAPYGTPPHEETTALLSPHGVRPAYDGLELLLAPNLR